MPYFKRQPRPNYLKQLGLNCTYRLTLLPSTFPMMRTSSLFTPLLLPLVRRVLGPSHANSKRSSQLTCSRSARPSPSASPAMWSSASSSQAIRSSNPSGSADLKMEHQVCTLIMGIFFSHQHENNVGLQLFYVQRKCIREVNQQTLRNTFPLLQKQISTKWFRVEIPKIWYCSPTHSKLTSSGQSSVENQVEGLSWHNSLPRCPLPLLGDRMKAHLPGPSTLVLKSVVFVKINFKTLLKCDTLVNKFNLEVMQTPFLQNV